MADTINPDDDIIKLINERFKAQLKAFTETVDKQKTEISELASQQKQELTKGVEKEINNIPGLVDAKIEHKLTTIWKDVDQRFRTKLYMLLVAAVSAIVIIFAFSTIKASTEANKSLIEFQQGVLDKQTAIMESDGRIRELNERISKAQDSLNSKLTALNLAKENLEKTKADLENAKKNYNDMIKKLSAIKR